MANEGSAGNNTCQNYPARAGWEGTPVITGKLVSVFQLPDSSSVLLQPLKTVKISTMGAAVILMLIKTEK